MTSPYLRLSGTHFERTAVVSTDGVYRYVLERRWDDTKEPLVFELLNPSTADAMNDDPTVRKCVGFANRFGYGGALIVNVFAYRATKPRDLHAAADPIGPENLTFLTDTMRDRDVVLGWGQSAWPSWCTETAVHETIQAAKNAKAICYLGKTKSGRPSHPLMLSYDRLLRVADHIDMQGRVR